MPDLSAQVDALLVQWNQLDTPGAAIAIVQDGEILYQQGYGMASIELDVPITPETVFPVASVAKQFTAAAIALLILEDKLNPDDNIRRYLPEFPDYGETITTAHLIHHTSGIRDWARLAWLSGDATDLWTEARVMEMLLRQQNLNFAPGSRHMYCNSGYVLLTMIVARISGVSFRQFCHENIFKPLGMNHSVFRDDHHMVIKGRASSYRYDPDGELQNITVHADVVGDFNLYTMVGDLAIWDANFYDNRLGGAKFLDLMHSTNPLTDGTRQDYAYGLVHDTYRGLKTVHHAGANASCRAQMMRFPEQKFTIICLSNTGSFNLNETVNGIADLYLAAPLPIPELESAPEDTDTPPTLSTERLTAYSGVYHSDELDTDYTLSVVDEGLVVTHPRLPDMPLTPINEDVFSGNGMEWVFHREGESMLGFDLSDGRAQGIRFSAID